MRAKITMAIAAIAAENLKDLKNPISSIGWLLRRSKATTPASTTAPATIAPSTTGEDQPRSGASMMPQTSSAIPAMERAAPTGSGRLLAGFFDGGQARAAATRPARAIGTLTRKIEPHQ